VFWTLALVDGDATAAAAGVLTLVLFVVAQAAVIAKEQTRTAFLNMPMKIFSFSNIPVFPGRSNRFERF